MKKWYNPEEYSKEQMQYKLEMLREFQAKYPDSHVGGSVGLYLHGINLQRDISRTDLDLTVPDWIDDLKGESYYPLALILFRTSHAISI